MSVIRQIVDRCHVADSNMDVIRFVLSRIAGKTRKEKYAHYRSKPRKERHQLLEIVITIHEQNRAVYRAVTRGRI